MTFSVQRSHLSLYVFFDLGKSVFGVEEYCFLFLWNLIYTRMLSGLQDRLDGVLPCKSFFVAIQL